MDVAAYREYQLESENWLKRGRRDLLSLMLRQVSNGRKNLSLLEVGAGVGQNVPALAEFGEVDVLEMSALGLEALRSMPGIRRIIAEPIPIELEATYDVIVALDVIEHIEDDRAAVKWITQRLRPGGIFFSTVPAYQWLYSEHDIALHHFRRYNLRAFKHILPPDLKVLRCGYFNSILFPVAASVRLAKKLVPGQFGTSSPARKQSGLVPGPINRLFQSILGLELGWIGKGVDIPFGLSVYCLAQHVESS